ncbi:hypothetical protein GCM10009836_11700 [Pseudonocardia ailaonensis]|uniref:Uncharacterized protein n=1 Tax=Pseudonocardia ailaonensis TaxID=367279 RepID=A0ABN2MQA1_9PSEU
MLGRNSYTRDELDVARAHVDALLTAVRATPEPALLAGTVLVLDRLFVHRVRAVSGKDTNPVTEVELLATSLLAGGTMVDQKAVKWVPASSVTGIAAGAPVVLDLATVENLAEAYLTEIEKRFVS